MNSKSIFHNTNIDFQIYNQSNNFEDACSAEDMQGFLPSSSSLSKVSSWHSFLAPERAQATSSSASATPNGTPQSSPSTNRKQLEAKEPNLSEHINSKRWFNAHLFPTLSEDNIAKSAHNPSNNPIRKSNSYKNVSNFDINAVGPISF